MAENYNVGIDIGGTKVNIGIVKENGEILDNIIIATNKEKEPEDFIADICEKTKELLYRNNLSIKKVYFIGVGVPGTADVNTGMVSYCPNLFWYDLPIGNMLEKNLQRDVKVMQDSRNAALAESLFGAGRGFDNILCVAIGTGIGGGIIINRKIFNGGMNTAGEIGHTPIIKNGRKCVCGNLGCLETYASGTGITDLALEKFPEKFTKLENRRCEYVFELAYAGDSEILYFIEECVDNLAFGIANAVSLLSPEAVIISGGLCVHEELFVKPLQDKIVQKGYYSWTHLNKLKVYKAELGSDAPMIGAALLYKGI